jgi:queuine/archaeosine tRNA-ribosyltransferase
MNFFASLTINRCHIIKLCTLWTEATGSHFPFSHVLVSPLVLRNGILPILYKHRRKCTVMFDSGGFHVQQKLLTLRDVAEPLATFYRSNDWAHIYVVPDFPLTSNDTKQQAAYKLTATKRQYTQFRSQVPKVLFPRLLPVVHGATISQVRRSAEAALRIGPRRLGFGSFATSGAGSRVNFLNRPGLERLMAFAEVCRANKVRSHVFGIGGPASMCVLKHVPVDSFDTAGWVRSAAYGHVYIPYLGTVNITGKSMSHRYMSAHEFRRTLVKTKHRCAFCRDHALLETSFGHRALHNFCVLVEMTHRLSHIPASYVLKQLNCYNERYAKYFKLVVDRKRLLS